MSFINKLKSKLYLLIKTDIEKSITEEEIVKYNSCRGKAIDFSSFNTATAKNATKETYVSLHDKAGYKENNWSFDILKQLEETGADSFFELGAGNGKFVTYLRAKNKTVYGVDLVNPTSNKYVITADFNAAFELSEWVNSEVIYSADFLEHLPLFQLNDLFSKMSKTNKKHVHLIACYDDYVSHETVLPPYCWALLISKYFNNVNIIDVSYRRFPAKKLVLKIAFSND